MNLYDLKKKLTPKVALTLPWGYIHVYYHSSKTSLLVYILLYIIDSIILILLKAITYNLYIYNQRGVTQLINIYFFLCFYNLLSRTL